MSLILKERFVVYKGKPIFYLIQYTDVTKSRWDDFPIPLKRGNTRRKMWKRAGDYVESTRIDLCLFRLDFCQLF